MKNQMRTNENIPSTVCMRPRVFVNGILDLQPKDQTRANVLSRKALI